MDRERGPTRREFLAYGLAAIAAACAPSGRPIEETPTPRVEPTATPRETPQPSPTPEAFAIDLVEAGFGETEIISGASTKLVEWERADFESKNPGFRLLIDKDSIREVQGHTQFVNKENEIVAVYLGIAPVEALIDGETAQTEFGGAENPLFFATIGEKRYFANPWSNFQDGLYPAAVAQEMEGERTPAFTFSWARVDGEGAIQETSPFWEEVPEGFDVRMNTQNGRLEFVSKELGSVNRELSRQIWEIEAVKIPEAIFPIYGTFVGYTENDSVGMILVRLPQPQPREVEYLLTYQKNTGGEGQVPGTDDIYAFNVFEPEPGVYRQTPDTERVHESIRPLPIIEIRPGEKEGELQAKLIIRGGGFASGDTYEFTLTFQGTGRETAYEEFREMVLKMASTTLSNGTIRLILKNQKIELA